MERPVAITVLIVEDEDAARDLCRDVVVEMGLRRFNRVALLNFVLPGMRPVIESDPLRSFDDSSRTPSRAAPFIHGRYRTHRRAFRETLCGTHNELEPVRLFCADSDTILRGHQGQTEDFARRCACSRSRQSGLCAARLGDGNPIRHNRAKQPAGLRQIAGERPRVVTSRAPAADGTGRGIRSHSSSRHPNSFSEFASRGLLVRPRPRSPNFLLAFSEVTCSCWADGNCGSPELCPKLCPPIRDIAVSTASSQAWT